MKQNPAFKKKSRAKKTLLFLAALWAIRAFVSCDAFYPPFDLWSHNLEYLGEPPGQGGGTVVEIYDFTYLTYGPNFTQPDRLLYTKVMEDGLKAEVYEHAAFILFIEIWPDTRGWDFRLMVNWCRYVTFDGDSYMYAFTEKAHEHLGSEDLNIEDSLIMHKEYEEWHSESQESFEDLDGLISRAYDVYKDIGPKG